MPSWSPPQRVPPPSVVVRSGVEPLHVQRGFEPRTFDVRALDADGDLTSSSGASSEVDWARRPSALRTAHSEQALLGGLLSPPLWQQLQPVCLSISDVPRWAPSKPIAATMRGGRRPAPGQADGQSEVRAVEWSAVVGTDADRGRRRRRLVAPSLLTQMLRQAVACESAPTSAATAFNGTNNGYDADEDKDAGASATAHPPRRKKTDAAKRCETRAHAEPIPIHPISLRAAQVAMRAREAAAITLKYHQNM